MRVPAARPRSPGRVDAPVRPLARAAGVDHRRPGRAPGAVRAGGVGHPDAAAPALGSPARPTRVGCWSTAASDPRRRSDFLDAATRPRHLAYGPEESAALLRARATARGDKPVLLLERPTVGLDADDCARVARAPRVVAPTRAARSCSPPTRPTRRRARDDARPLRRRSAAELGCAAGRAGARRSTSSVRAARPTSVRCAGQAGSIITSST